MSTYSQYNHRCRPSIFSIAIVSFFITGGVNADNRVPVPRDKIDFDASFLDLDNVSSADLSRFALGASGTPGVYKTAVHINGQWMGDLDMEFKERENKSVYPCLTRDLIKRIAFNHEKLPADFFKLHREGELCLDLQHGLPDTQINYDSNEQRLDILIPQVYMLNTARDTVNPELWDSGVLALLLGYNVNGYTSGSKGNTYNSLFAGVNAGLNVEAWYLRHNGAYTRSADGANQYNNINTYLQRDIPALKARMLMGQANTSGQGFDTLPFTGIQLATDEAMLPASLRGYAPEIRGIARTNARVTVRQNNLILYETTVTPGAFLINDLYPAGYGGNLEVTVRESDGSEQTFSVPFASMAQLLRPGASHYTITVGEIRSSNLREQPALYQATYQRGVTNAITGYGGVQVSQHYHAFQLGTALGTPLGAFSVDITQARTHLGNRAGLIDAPQEGTLMRGKSYQISYSKNIKETNSNLSLAAYRFSTDGYMDMMTAMRAREAMAESDAPDTILRARSRVILTVGQGLRDGWGQLHVSGSQQDYWDRAGSEKQYQVGYSNSDQNLSYGLSVNRSVSRAGIAQTHYLLSFSVPLGRHDPSHTPQLRMNISQDSSGRQGQQATLSGTTGVEDQFSYGVTAMNANQGSGSGGSVNGNYRSPVTALSGGYSISKRARSASVGLSGSVIAHTGGLTLTPYTSETFALVEAKGAEGARVSSYPGVSVDPRGYALVPYLSPYQMNEISIDPKGTEVGVELDNTSQKVAPYSGAVVKVKYNVKQGTPILVNATYHGEPLPFGADVVDRQGNSVGGVGQGGQVYVHVPEDKGQLRVKWGERREMQCIIGYILMPRAKMQTGGVPIQQFNSECKSVADK